MRRIERATDEAYRAIVARWMTHVDRTNWVHFDNIAAWDTAYLDRAAATEFIQLGNNRAAASYYNAWKTGSGQALNGLRNNYQVTFPANNIPDAQRFRSITAYTPDTVELIRNPANKYLVASYTPGLRYNKDGSVTIYMSVTNPRTYQPRSRQRSPRPANHTRRAPGATTPQSDTPANRRPAPEHRPGVGVPRPRRASRADS